MPDVDQTLIASLRRRDAAAFETIFTEYSNRIFRLAAGILGDEDQAEGVVQDTFLKLFESLDQFEGRSGLGTWLYRVAYNNCLDRLRKRRPVLPIEDELRDSDNSLPIPAIFVDWSQTPESQLDSVEMSDQLREGIAGLPEKLRSTFILREIEGLSTGEAAEVLGISDGAVKVQLHRARLLLRERLSTYFSERVTAAKDTHDEL
jgi:RNA polymerase sigma-70 factor (ECF subfamily)